MVTLLAAIAVALRVSLILIACAMVVGLRQECWAVICRKPGWQAQLTSAVFTLLVVAGAVISSVNIFPDAGWHISPRFRLIGVNIGLGLFLVGVLTGLYRRALKSGPGKARAALLSGVAMFPPGIALVALLTNGGG